MPDTPIIFDAVAVGESVSITKSVDFNDILRSYPFLQRTITGFIEAEFENGVVQERDTWGRYKKTFEINFPPLTRGQANEIENFYEQNKGSIFSFTHPWNGNTYQVRIADKEFILSRTAFNTFYAKMLIEEVF